MSNQFFRPKAQDSSEVPDKSGPPEHVPYKRLQEVVFERNRARDAAAEKDREIAELKAKLEKLESAKTNATHATKLCGQNAAILSLLSQLTSAHLQSLYTECRRKILDAAYLLESNADEVKLLQAHFVQTWNDINPLTAAFQTLQKRYADEIYDAQISLFPIDRIEPEEAYQEYFYHSVIPTLIESPALVKNVVRALGGWPCKNRELAASAVFQFMTEMSLPHPSLSTQQTIKSNKSVR